MADQPNPPAIKPGLRTTELYLSLIGLFIAGWGVYALTSLLPSIVKEIPAAQNPAFAGVVALAITAATGALGWLARLIAADYGKIRTQLKLGAAPELPSAPKGFAPLGMLVLLAVTCVFIGACTHLTPFEAGEVNCAKEEASAVESMVPEILADLGQKNWVALLDQMLVASGPAAACAINTAIAQLRSKPATSDGQPNQDAALRLQAYAEDRGLSFQ
jgi:hypothetical protein